jgi:hypothetical protein
MLVWLASYPRSGNTLLRILLKRAFDIETYSYYDGDIEALPELISIVGHRRRAMKAEELIARAQGSSEIVFVKTHERPHDATKAIYVVRDGRATVVSYWHYLQDFEKQDVSLDQVITGDVWAGSWSHHVRTWALGARPNTLVLRFEDMVADNERPLAQIAAFLGIPRPRAAKVEFEELHAASPKFFRSGSNSGNIEELNGSDLKLFWACHRDAMVRLGYDETRPDSTPSPSRTFPRSYPPLQRATIVAGIRRNEQCPCGSGKRYKHCHGRL